MSWIGQLLVFGYGRKQKNRKDAPDKRGMKMSKDHRRQQLIWGAATVGILGALTALLRNQNNRRGPCNQNLVAGGLAGGIIGAIAALLYAPTSGSTLRNQIVHPFARYLQQNSPLKKMTKKRASPKKKSSEIKKFPRRPKSL